MVGKDRAVSASSDLLSRFTRALATEPGAELPRRMCGAFARVLGADGAAIALGTARASRTLLAATDQRTEQIEDLQDMVGEGPSLQAMAGAGPAVLSGSGDKTWPMLADALARHAGGARRVTALYAFPMRPQREVLGVLSALRTRPAGLAVTLEEAQLLANVVGVAVLGDLASERAGPTRWLDRDRIAQAAGMVVAQLGIPPLDAMAVLRAHAYARDLTLSEVSRRVVDRSMRFTPTSEEES